MGSFKDNEGREWTPRVTCGTLEAFEELTNIDLLTEIHQAIRSIGGLNAEAGMAKIDSVQAIEFIKNVFGGKIRNVNTAVYVTVRRQANERDVSREDFAELMSGETLATAFKEVIKAYADFFRPMMAGLSANKT